MVYSTEKSAANIRQPNTAYSKNLKAPQWFKILLSPYSLMTQTSRKRLHSEQFVWHYHYWQRLLSIQYACIILFLERIRKCYLAILLCVDINGEFTQSMQLEKKVF